MISVLTLLVAATGLIINLYTLYTIRMQLGKLGKEALDKAKDAIKDLKD